MAAKMILACFMAVLILDTTSVLGFFRRPGPMPDCLTDASCGVDALTATFGTINYCCAKGVKLSLGVEAVKGVIKPSCKCLKPFDFRSMIPKGFPQMCQGYEPGKTTPCGANAKTGKANSKDVCCKAEFTIHIYSKTRRGATKQYCRCKAPAAAKAAATAPGAAATAAAPPAPGAAATAVVA